MTVSEKYHYLYQKSYGVKIAQIDDFLPDGITTNEDIITQNQLRLKDEWVQKSIGIRQRHWCKNGETASDLGAKALRKVLPSKSSLEGLIVSTVSEDVMTPSTACIIQSKATPGELYPAFDIKAACAGFIFALDMGRRMIQTGAKKIACVATETRSYYLDKKDRRTVMLFGDGAAAAILEKTQKNEIGIFYSHLISDGRFWDAIFVPASGGLIQARNEAPKNSIVMNDASGIFDSAILKMQELINNALTECKLTKNDIDHFIIHQASKNIVAKVADELKLDPSQFTINFDQVGNITSASVGVLLSQCLKEKRIKKGDLICLIATGGGYSAGIILLRWEQDL